MKMAKGTLKNYMGLHIGDSMPDGRVLITVGPRRQTRIAFQALRLYLPADVLASLDVDRFCNGESSTNSRGRGEIWLRKQHTHALLEWFFAVG